MISAWESQAVPCDSLVLFMQKVYDSIIGRGMNMTTKNKYLLKLKNKMLFNFTASAIAATLADMNQIFDAAAEEGKTEEEVCRELGEPAGLVQQMIEEDSLKSSFSNSRLFFLLLAVGVVAGTGILWYLDKHWALGITYDTPYLWTLPALAIPALLWYLSGSCCLYEFPPNRTAGRIVNLLVLVVTLSCVVFEQAGLSRTVLDMDIIMAWKNLIVAAGEVAGTGMLFALILCIFVAVLLFFGKYIYFPTLLLCSGFWFTSMMCRKTIAGLDAPAAAWLPLLLMAVPYAVCLVCAIIWIWKTSKKEIK